MIQSLEDEITKKVDLKEHSNNELQKRKTGIRSEDKGVSEGRSILQRTNKS